MSPPLLFASRASAVLDDRSPRIVPTGMRPNSERGIVSGVSMKQ
jgi:hypothetical protein